MERQLVGSLDRRGLPETTETFCLVGWVISHCAVPWHTHVTPLGYDAESLTFQCVRENITEAHTLRLLEKGGHMTAADPIKYLRRLSWFADF